jgi:hypothetical protein
MNGHPGRCEDAISFNQTEAAESLINEGLAVEVELTIANRIATGPLKVGNGYVTRVRMVVRLTWLRRMRQMQL